MFTTEESLIFASGVTSIGIVAGIFAFVYIYRIRMPTIRKRLKSIPDFDDSHIFMSNTYGLAFDFEKNLLAYDDGKKTIFISASELLAPTKDPYHVPTRRNRSKHVVHLRTLSNDLPRIDLLYGDSDTADRCKNAILKIINAQETSQSSEQKIRHFSEKEQKTIATLKNIFWKNKIRKERLTKKNLKPTLLDAIDLAYREFPSIHGDALYKSGNQIVLRNALEFVFLVAPDSNPQIGYTESTIRQHTSERVSLLKEDELRRRKLNSTSTVSA